MASIKVNPELLNRLRAKKEQYKKSSISDTIELIVDVVDKNITIIPTVEIKTKAGKNAKN